jgi:hypothetical protein
MAGEPGALRKKSWAGEEQGQGGIASLEKFDDRVDGIQIGRLDRQHLLGFSRQFSFARSHVSKQGLDSGSAKESQHHVDPEIGLGGLNPAATEKSREIGGGGVGRIQLSERGDKQQNARTSHGLDIP